MSLTWKLFWAHARQQRVRLSLTALAMIAAVGVVLWVVSAYESIASKFDDQVSDFIGKYTAFVAPASLDDALNPELVAAIGDAAGVAEANAVTQFRMSLRRIGEPPVGKEPRGRMGPLGPTVVGTNALTPRYELVDGRWLGSDATNETVVSNGIADVLMLEPGDALEFSRKGREPVTLTVVGITEQPDEVEFAMMRTKGGAPGGTNRGPASLAAYVPLSVVEQLIGESPKINLVEIRLAPNANTQKLAEVVAPLVAKSEPAADLIRPEDVRAKLASGFAAQGARKQAYFVTALSILASAFIIFTTLSMGVNKRARQLAVLRAVGLRRSQVAMLVLAESLVLAVFGWVGGLLGGWILLKSLAAAQPSLFPNGIAFGLSSVLLTGGCALFGALLAAIFPIWKATRISPLEAMAPLPMRSNSFTRYALAGVISLVLIALNPLLVGLPGIPESVRFALILLIGGPATVLGFLFLAPIVVVAVEKLFTAPVAWLLRLQPQLVKTQLSANMWRSAGIAASLMLGLGLYTATQVWGYSMLGGFLPGRWAPNTIVKFEPGIPDVAIEKVRQTQGVGEVCLPIAVEQTKLVGDPLKSAERDSAVRQNSATLIGADVDEAFGGEQPAFQLHFVQGNRDEALAKLKQGRYCLVPESIARVGGLGVGDKLGFIPPKSPDKPVEYTIAGVVELPGTNFMTKSSGLRRGTVRTAGIVLANRPQVRADFDLKLAEFFWLNKLPEVSASELEENLIALLPPGRRGGGPRGGGGRGESATPSAAGKSRDQSTKGDTASKGERGGRTRRGGPGGGPGNRPVQVTSIDEVRDGLQRRGGGAVRALGWLPMVTLLVVSLGIVNTIAASVRARSWEFGILRSVGLRRFALARLVLSEALLIGLVASALSFAFGLLVGWTCLGLVRYVSNPWFEGVATPLVIPWTALASGYGLTFALCFVAALWPAFSSGRREPLSLLQAGRAAA